ncbi:MAG: NUDIX hydrolase [Oscillospiraceae bacterium]|nr:NUDIX hydrolase [Oscillospiraceae bacterium]
MEIREKTLSNEKIYDGKIMKIHKDTVELPNGNQAFREIVEHSGGVCVLPLTDCRNIILVEQFRYPFAKAILEIPAGKLELAERHNPLECGKRELFEETGYHAKEFVSLGEFYPTPAYCTEVIHMYLAKGLYVENAHNNDLTPQNHLDDDEFLNVIKLPVSKILEMILGGEIPDGKTQAAVLKSKVLGHFSDVV